MQPSAKDIVEDKAVFNFPRCAADSRKLHQMFDVLLQTKVGSQLISDIGALCRNKQDDIGFWNILPSSYLGCDFPIRLRITSPDKLEEGFGFCSENLVIDIVRIRDTDMTEPQKEKLLLKYVLTLGHELMHALQSLKNYTQEVKQFSLPHRIYSYVLDEAESSLLERRLEKELSQLYPQASKGILFWMNHHKSDEENVRSFFQGRKHRYLSKMAIDYFSVFPDNHKMQVLSNHEEKNRFAKWVDNRLRQVDVALTYKDMPLSSCFWFRKLFSKWSLLFGQQVGLSFDSQGRLNFVLDGDFMRRKTVSEVFLFAKASDKDTLYQQKMIHRLFPKASIRLKRPLKSCAYASDIFNEHKKPLNRFDER